MALAQSDMDIEICLWRIQDKQGLKMGSVQSNFSMEEEPLKPMK